MIFAVASLFIILLLMLPKGDPDSQKKMASASMLMCSQEYREMVATWLASEEAPLPAFDNRCPGVISSLAVDEDGVMTLHNATHGLTLMLTPQQEPGGLRWGCRGKPAQLVTKLCKP